MNKDLDAIEDAMKSEPSIKFYVPALKAGVAALRRDKKAMLRALREALNKGYLSVGDVELYPVFEDYHDDPDFKSLISGGKNVRREKTVREKAASSKAPGNGTESNRAVRKKGKG